MASHIVAIGANLSYESLSPLQLGQAALVKISRIPGITSLVCSPWYSSAPIPPSGQPRYFNAAARFDLAMAPAALLALLLALESEAGRQRAAVGAARSLDLDLIDSGGVVRAAPDPVLPHPRAHLRAFVLRPLRDVAPAWRHPVLGRTVSALLAALPPQDVRLA